MNRTAGWLEPADSALLVSSVLPGQGRQAIILGTGQEQHIIAEGAHAKMVAIDRLMAVSQGVEPLGDRLIAVVVGLAVKLDHAE